MAEHLDEFHRFQSIAVNHFDYATDLLSRIEKQYKNDTKEEVTLCNDADLLLGVVYAKATIEIGCVAGQVRSAVFRHDVFNAIGTIVEYAMDLNDHSICDEIDQIISDLREVMNRPPPFKNHNTL